MKSVLNDSNVGHVLPFPKLMQSHNRVVLFTDYGVGTVIHHDETELSFGGIGYFCKNWDMAYFKDFNGSITISN